MAVNLQHTRPKSAPPDPLAVRILQPLERFLHVEAASGVVLLALTALAVIWANSPWWESYERLWHAPFTIGFGTFIVQKPLHFWVNDGLMTLFFLVVGLEIRRELHNGALADRRRAALPLAAALGGIVVPAAIYLALNPGEELRRGWAVPTATDIAFAVGVLAVLGKRVPGELRVLLLALAIIDDIAAVLIIAFFYSSGVKVTGLLVVALGVAAVLGFQRAGVRSAFSYVLPGSIVWLGLLQAGVHPTLAGVILGLMTPVRTAPMRENPLASAGAALEEYRRRIERRHGDLHELAAPVRQLRRAQRELLAPVYRVQIALHPWVAFVIMPVFALANAGVRVESFTLDSTATGSVALGIVLALVLGKPLGILIGSALAVRAGLGALGPSVTWRGVLLVGALGGIGFTMSIFIANLAFPADELLASAKLAVLVGSAIAGLTGLALGQSTLSLRAAQAREASRGSSR